MEYLIGVILALGISTGSTLIGFDRERSFYSTVLIVVALYYALFAAMSGSTLVMMKECLPILLFVAAAGIGFKKAQGWVIAGLVGHGVFDFFHGSIITNPGVPLWWPGFCMAYDVTAGVYLAVLVWRRSQVGSAGKVA